MPEQERKHAHTPGPWEYNPRIHRIESATDRKHPVADIRGWGYLTGRGHFALGLSDDEALAVQDEWGRLIAAAPDLLSELSHLVGLLEPLERDGSLEVPGLATLNAARTAIDKARGDSRAEETE